MDPLPPPKRPSALVLTAHGSADPRSGAVTHAVADRIRRLRPSLDVRVAFCERTEPNLREVLAALDRPGVITPLLLASGYHARVDIPAMIAEAGSDVIQADTLGEDPRLVDAARERLTDVVRDRWVGGRSDDVGVLMVAVGSSDDAANARTATVAAALEHDGRWAGVRMAYATGPKPSVSEGFAQLREFGARHIAVVPWFIAPGRITDRVAAAASAEGAAMAEPLGAHPLVVATVLDRFDRATARRLAA